MIRRASIGAGVAAGVIGLLLAVFLSAGPVPSAQARQDDTGETRDADDSLYTVDGVHSSVMFRIMHQDIAYFYGRFNKISGSLHINEADPEESTLKVEIDTSSVDTNNESRDNHVRSGDYLSVTQFPEATFEATSFEKSGDTYRVTGDMTLHGKTEEITVDLKLTGEGVDQRGNSRQGIETIFELDRTDYGIGSPGGLGETVRMYISLEAVRG